MTHEIDVPGEDPVDVWSRMPDATELEEYDEIPPPDDDPVVWVE